MANEQSQVMEPELDESKLSPAINPLFGGGLQVAMRTPTSDGLRMGVCVVRAGRFKIKGAFRSPVVRSDSVIIGWVDQGWLQGEMDGQRMCVSAHQFGIINSVRRCRFIGSEDLHINWIELVGTATPAFLNLLAPKGAAVFPLGWSDSINGTFDEIIDEMLEGTVNESELSRLATELLFTLSTKQEELNEHDILVVHEAMAYICSNFHRNLTIDEIARQEGVSKFRLIRSFQAVAGVTPYAYIIQMRINAAKWMLVWSTNQINEISRWCGFANDTTFGVAFKKETGLTPRQWRNLHQYRDEE